MGPEGVSSMETGRGCWGQGAGAEGREGVFHGERASLWEEEKFPETHVLLVAQQCD